MSRKNKGRKRGKYRREDKRRRGCEETRRRGTREYKEKRAEGRRRKNSRKKVFIRDKMLAP
ncbi:MULTISPECIES: hypothetical protein [unclassified Paraflavitalea]|uniref:hypothetical protein n=1 Tax=unclassified Paraflavitalea TaxID=2798305 RepID=UPI003D353E5D